jgi:hypothetical protein
MGIIKKGILGGFSGKVGNVVGASWKGIDYIRSLPSTVRNPRTPRQVKQRTKFSLVQGFLTSMTPFIRIGFKNYAGGQTAMNAALSYNIQNGIIGEGADIDLDYPNLLVSRGSLFSTTNTSLECDYGEVTFGWQPVVAGNASVEDTVKFLMFNPAKGESVYNDKELTRSQSESFVDVPSTWVGDTVECYLTFISEDGKEVSNSKYMGNIEITEE